MCHPLHSVIKKKNKHKSISEKRWTVDISQSFHRWHPRLCMNSHPEITSSAHEGLRSEQSHLQVSYDRIWIVKRTAQRLWLASHQDNVLKQASFYSAKFIHQLEHGPDSCLVLFMKWEEQDLWQMLHRARDKEWANSLVWLDRVESFPPQLSKGNICVLANERCLFCEGAIGSLQPSEVTDSVTVQVKSEIEMEGRRGE